jgi:formylglycine-generating enzyme required for sulfatase activity
VGRYRVIRGGGWYSTAAQLPVANRQWFVPEYGEVSIGIRCVR